MVVNYVLLNYKLIRNFFKFASKMSTRHFIEVYVTGE